MPGRILRSPRARQDLKEVWRYIAEDNEAAADALLDRIETVLQRLASNPMIGRLRPDLLPEIRSFPVGNYVIFYRPDGDGVVLVRIRSRYRDVAADDVGDDP